VCDESACEVTQPDYVWKLHEQLECARCGPSPQQKRSAPVFSSTPLADVTPRHSQTATPFAKQYDRAMSASVLLTPAALAGQENVEEQCLSANRWLRGLAEECVDNMYTPAKPQAVDDVEDEPQVLHSQCLVLLDSGLLTMLTRP